MAGIFVSSAMLKTLWAIDALLMLGVLTIAFMSRGIDQAGRGILLAVPLIIGVALAGSFFANRSGALPLAVGLAMVGPAIAAGVFLTFGREQLRIREEESGKSYWSEPAMHELVRAIAKGDTAGARAAIAAGADVNRVGKSEMTVLDFTITHRPEMVGLVLQLGANPNRKFEGRVSPLAQSLSKTGDAFEQLLSAGADPNGPGENLGLNILFSAIASGWPARYELLVKHGADVNQRDEQGRTALMQAAESSQWKIASDLLKRGVDPGVVAQNGSSLAVILERAAKSYGDDADYQAFVAELNQRQKK